MSDTAYEILSNYYGFENENNSERTLSIHECPGNRIGTRIITPILIQYSSQDSSEDNIQENDNSASCTKNNTIDEDDNDPDSNFIHSDYVTDEIDPVSWTELQNDLDSKIDDEVELSDDGKKYSQNSSIVSKDLKETNQNIDDNILQIPINESIEPQEKLVKPSISLNDTLSHSNGVFLDLTGFELNEFPVKILDSLSNLRMLYLENNNLTDLPEEMFLLLPYLEWLDVRNNRLTTISKNIKSQLYLETLLLQGNQIQELPSELGCLPKLKVLQIANNPLIAPSKEILASGCTGVIEFLRKQWNQLHPEEPFDFLKKTIKPTPSTNLCYQSPRKRNTKMTKDSNGSTGRKSLARVRSRNYKPSNRCRNDKIMLGEETYSFWITKIREILHRQELILQKRKDKTTIERWRLDRRSFNRSIEKARNRNEDDIPFGIDNESLPSSFKKSKKITNKNQKEWTQISAKDINDKIHEIIDRMNKLENNNSEPSTPRTKQQVISNEITQMMIFKKEIEKLRRYNDMINFPKTNAD